MKASEDQRRRLFEEYNTQLLKSVEKKAQRLRDLSNGEPGNNTTCNRLFTLERAVATPPKERIRKSLSKSSRGTTGCDVSARQSHRGSAAATTAATGKQKAKHLRKLSNKIILTQG
jgi:hypothetical protein